MGDTLYQTAQEELDNAYAAMEQVENTQMPTERGAFRQDQIWIAITHALISIAESLKATD